MTSPSFWTAFMALLLFARSSVRFFAIAAAHGRYGRPPLRLQPMLMNSCPTNRSAHPPGGQGRLCSTSQVPGLVVILNEQYAMYRQIFTDGRALPVDPNPSWVGYSSGTWEGDTLVVRTIGFRDGLWLDANGSPMTADARVTERFRRVSYGKLEIELTVDDPKSYRTPWTVTLNQFIALDTELLDYICNENELDALHLVGK